MRIDRNAGSNNNPNRPKRVSAAWSIAALTVVFSEVALMLPVLTPYLAVGTFLTNLAIMKGSTADPNCGSDANGKFTYAQFKADIKAGKGSKPLNLKQVFLAAALGCAPGLVGHTAAQETASYQAAIANEKATPALNMSQQISASTLCQLAEDEQIIKVDGKEFRVNCP